MFRKTATWIVLVLISIGCTVFAFFYFSEAFPIVNIDLQMDRETALEKAGQLAEERNWALTEDFRQAASFGVDSQVQTFVELEAGGREAFVEMMEDGLYLPYRWTVRHFREGETNEAYIEFTPAGDLYGFRLVLPEDKPGASLPASEARELAAAEAGKTWSIDFSEYDLVEESEEVLPGGRTDHTFVYERNDKRIGEGRYRLRLLVGGDQLTQLSHLVKVPEAFSRRYEEMRSANEAVSFGAAVVIGLLYLIGGCIIGLFLLLRERWVIWKKPLFWGLLIAFLQFLVGINQLPLSWMGYDTAVSASGFLLQQIISIMAGSLAMGGILVVSFMAAESLTRKAFPNKIQFWKIWSPNNAGSPTVLGQTVAGYLLVGIFFAYEVSLYFVTTRHLGWWTPSEALFHPDSLATYFPWLTSIAISAQAGFWEECLFRAVPLAGAALIGRRLGRERLWIIGAFILQAVIFGAGHANYPAQPAYARLVELIIPSFAFAAIYLLFGLLPAIVLHFAFDVVWFALPIFVASSPGVWIDQALIIILTLIPLWAVVWARYRRGCWTEVQEDQLNRSWSPPSHPEEIVETAALPVAPSTFPSYLRTAILLSGVFGITLWLIFANFKSFAPAVEVGRTAAESKAQDELTSRQISLDGWERISLVQEPLGSDDRFVWQAGGPETYANLMGSYLEPPYWSVRYLRFTGDVAARAERYEIQISPKGEPTRFVHRLPEDASGADLEEEEARQIAEVVIRDEWKLEPENLEFVSSEPSKLPERTDWEFVFADPSYPLSDGQAKLLVRISGDRVTDAYRFVDVPENWEREQKNNQNIIQIVQLVSYILLGGFLLGGAVLAIVSWSRGKFSVKAFLVFSSVVFVLALVQAFNSWPGIKASFSTAQPYRLQLGISLVAILIQSLLLAAAIGLVAGLVYFWVKGRGSSSTQPVVVGLALSAIFGGLLSLLMELTPPLSPTWASYGAADGLLPIAGAAVGPLTGFIIRSLFVLLLASLVLEFSANWTKRQNLFRAALFLAGLLIAGTNTESLASWLVRGFVIGILLILAFEFALRYQVAIAPVIVAGLVILGLIRELNFDAYRGAVVGNIAAIVLVILFTVAWSRSLMKQEEV